MKLRGAYEALCRNSLGLESRSRRRLYLRPKSEAAISLATSKSARALVVQQPFGINVGTWHCSNTDNNSALLASYLGE